MNKGKFQALVRRILKEEIEKRIDGNLSAQVNPTMNSDGVDPERKERTFPSDENARDIKAKEELLAQLTKAVHSIKPDYTVVWDDHDDLMVSGRDMVNIQITPQWEDSYRIRWYVRNEDRFLFNNCTWQQVLDFVKGNLDKPRNPSYVEKARDKSWRNALDQTKDPDKGMPEKDKPKIKPLTNVPPSGKENKEKDYTVNDVTDKTDVQDQPMKDAEEFKAQRTFKTQNVKSLTKTRTPYSTRVVNKRYPTQPKS